MGAYTGLVPEPQPHPYVDAEEIVSDALDPDSGSQKWWIKTKAQLDLSAAQLSYQRHEMLLTDNYRIISININDR
jgi:hypothetical protein